MGDPVRELQTRHGCGFRQESGLQEVSPSSDAFAVGLSLAKVCSFLALVIALSTGTAYAANTFTNSLTTADVRGADVNGGHISIDGGAVANGRCRDFSMTIAGAHSGEAVVFSLQPWG